MVTLTPSLARHHAKGGEEVLSRGECVQLLLGISGALWCSPQPLTARVVSMYRATILEEWSASEAGFSPYVTQQVHLTPKTPDTML